MQATNVALILAAGNGSRLKEVSGSIPKPLVRVDGRPLLEHVILGLQVAGVDRFVVVIGHGGAAIQSWLMNRQFPGAQIELIENLEYFKPNGVSALKARHAINQPFLLLMADHLFDPQTATDLLHEPIQSGTTILAVDYKLHSIFDMDDATKVSCHGKYISHIGKDLIRYNAVDTGMFLCTPALFSALEQSMVNGSCSLSDGMRLLAAYRRLHAFDIGDAFWQDVDTPDALEYANALLQHRYATTRVVTEAVHV
jgi:choline kinase